MPATVKHRDWEGIPGLCTGCLSLVYFQEKVISRQHFLAFYSMSTAECLRALSGTVEWMAQGSWIAAAPAWRPQGQGRWQGQMRPCSSQSLLEASQLLLLAQPPAQACITLVNCRFSPSAALQEVKPQGPWGLMHPKIFRRGIYNVLTVLQVASIGRTVTGTAQEKFNLHKPKTATEACQLNLDDLAALDSRAYRHF